jgi:hypothetical protein
MVMRSSLLCSAILLPLLGLALASCSRADKLCGLVCDCSHCNDWEEDNLCAQIGLAQDVADDYDCGSAWDSWAECFENNGKCYADQAAYATRDLGSCNTNVDLQVTCTISADCAQAHANAFCSAGRCYFRACNGTNPPQQCSTSAQCPAGEDKCEQVADVLLQCEQQAADINVTPIWPPGG